MSQRFKVRDKLLKILKMVGASEKLFTTEQVKKYLGKYIDERNLYDPKMRVVVCKGDLLEDVFGVQQLTISNYKDFWQFVFPNLIPATNREVQEHESECKTIQNNPQESDNTNGKMDFKWMSQLPWWYFVQKDKEDNMDKATASGSIVANTTIHAVDTEYDTATDISNSVDLGYDDEDRFSEEYEPDSEDSFSSDGTEPLSPIDKPELQLPVRRSVVSSDNETMTTTTTTTTETSCVSMEYEIPMEDQWICGECSTINLPTFGYCERCWKMRKGWLAETSLPSPGLRKSFTLPSSQKSREDKFEYPETSSIPKLARSSSQPNPSIVGIDVTDGYPQQSQQYKNDELTTNDSFKDSMNTSPHAAGSSTNNFDNLPFNQLKRKHSSLSQTYFPVSKIGKTNSDDDGSAKIKNTMEHIETPKKFTRPTTLLKCNVKSDSTCSQAGSSDHSNENMSSSVRTRCSFSTPGLCNICHNKPNDATIIHGDSGHQYCCYRCAKKLKKRGRTCPVCRQPIASVHRNFICQM